MPTKIEWTDEAWNPFSGCTPISEGCDNCYAAKMAKRLRGRCGYPADDPFRPTFHPDKLEQPLHWKKPKKIFVCSMSDLFHDQHHFYDINSVCTIMREAQRHTFQVLTKRPRTACDFYDTVNDNRNIFVWPKNIWFGITAENQERLEERLPFALKIPAAIRFLSIEPMLGPIDIEAAVYRAGRFPESEGTGIDWVICGGETGQGKNIRPINQEWVISLRDQCKLWGIPFFFKQWGKKYAGRILEGRTWEEMPNGK